MKKYIYDRLAMDLQTGDRPDLPFEQTVEAYRYLESTSK